MIIVIKKKCNFKTKIDMIALKNYTVTEDSITIPKQELERLIEHYNERVNFFWNPNPMSPQSWGLGLFQGKREMCNDFLKLINEKE